MQRTMMSRDMLVTGYKLQGTGYRLQDSGCWIPDTGYWRDGVSVGTFK
jgi:hypothetical protein